MIAHTPVLATRGKGIELIKKDKRRCLLFRIFEKSANLFLPAMDIRACQVRRLHFDESESEEVSQLSGYKGLAAAGRPIEQYATWKADLKALCHFGIAQWKNDVSFQLSLNSAHPGYTVPNSRFYFISCFSSWLIFRHDLKMQRFLECIFENLSREILWVYFALEACPS